MDSRALVLVNSNGNERLSNRSNFLMITPEYLFFYDKTTSCITLLADKHKQHNY